MAKNVIENKDTITIQIGDKDVVLKIEQFTGDIDVDDLLQVDYNNILGDCITWPVLFNRIGRLKAETEALVALSKADFDAFEAELFSKFKKQLIARGDKATEAAIDSEMKMSREWKLKKYDHIDTEKKAAIVFALYDSARKKSTMLETVSNKIRPEEFEQEILEGRINDVMIKVHKSIFPNKK